MQTDLYSDAGGDHLTNSESGPAIVPPPKLVLNKTDGFLGDIISVVKDVSGAVTAKQDAAAASSAASTALVQAALEKKQAEEKTKKTLIIAGVVLVIVVLAVVGLLIFKKK